MASEAAIDLSVIIVSWNVSELLDACLRSVFADLAAAPLAGEVIVVDSASTDGSPDMVRERYPQAQLLAQDENIGFVRANNLGLRRCQGRQILLLNPDTEVLSGALAAMCAYMQGHPEVGIVGPKLLNPDGSVQSSRRRFPTLATAFMESTVLQQWFPRHRLLRRYYVSDRSDDETQEVDWVTGACFLVRREALTGVGLMDEALFMYSEELDWAYRIKRAGWRVAYVPAAQVVHYGGQSSSQVVAAQHIYFQSSKVYFFRKHHGAVAAELLRWFLLGTYAYQWLREGLKWLVGHKRALRAQRLRTYAQVMRSGLKQAGRVS